MDSEVAALAAGNAQLVDSRLHVAWVTETMEATASRRERQLIELLIQDVCRARADDPYLLDAMRELGRLVGRLAETLFTDSLTGVRNRRGYLVDGMQLLERAERLHRTAMVFCFDLDGLKAINDTCGHSSGDAVLRRAAQLLEKTFGPGSVIGRIGGDEFAAATLTDGPSESLALLRRIRDCVGAPTDPSRADVHLSVGLSTYHPGDHLCLGEMLDQADRAMYASRRAHRDQGQSLPSVALADSSEARLAG